MRAHSSSCSISRADGADCGRSSGVADLAAAAAPRGTALPATLPTAGGCTAAEALDGRWILGPPPPGTRTEEANGAAHVPHDRLPVLEARARAEGRVRGGARLSTLGRVDGLRGGEACLCSQI